MLARLTDLQRIVQSAFRGPFASQCLLDVGQVQSASPGALCLKQLNEAPKLLLLLLAYWSQWPLNYWLALVAIASETHRPTDRRQNERKKKSKGGRGKRQVSPTEKTDRIESLAKTISDASCVCVSVQLRRWRRWMAAWGRASKEDKKTQEGCCCCCCLANTIHRWCWNDDGGSRRLEWPWR